MSYRSLLSVALGAVLLVSASAVAQAQIVVADGHDLFETTAGTDFLNFPFEGEPLGTFDFGFGQVAVDATDTIVERLDPAIVAVTPATAPPIAIEMVALQLKSAAPVDLGCGVDDYFITLSAAPPSTGTMDIFFADPNGGTFDSTIIVNFDVRINNVAGPICFSDSQPLTSTNSPWSRTAPPNTLLIPSVNHLLNGLNNAQDFHAAPVELHPAGLESEHHVRETFRDDTIPTLGEWGLIVMGALLAIVALYMMRRRSMSA